MTKWLAISRTPGRRTGRDRTGVAPGGRAADVEAWSRIDKPYHVVLLAVAGNRFLRRAIEDVRRRLQCITYHVAIQPEHMLSGTRDHEGLAQAISDSDARAAAEIMQQHLQMVAAHAVQLIRRYIVPVRGARF